jgi:hypothetical protein
MMAMEDLAAQDLGLIRINFHFRFKTINIQAVRIGQAIISAYRVGFSL